MGIGEKLKKARSYIESIKEVEDQSFSEAVLGASGINIPLPTQEEAIEFYVLIKDPNNILTTIDPQDWSRIQYLEYQSDVRKYRAKSRFTSIKDARKLKEEKKKSKEEKEVKKYKQAFLDRINKKSLDESLENVPEDQKPKGVQKLGALAENIFKVVAKTCLPTLLNMVEQAGLATFESKKQEVLDELGIEGTLDELQNLTDPAKLEEVKNQLCPTPEVLDKIIQQRNGIISFLNNQQEKVNNLKISADGTGDAITWLSNAIRNAENAIFVSNFAAGFLAVDSPARTAIEIANKAVEVLKEDKDGKPRIPPLRGAVSNFSLPLNKVNSLFTEIVVMLQQFDQIINLCAPFATLDPLSDDVFLTVANQLLAQDTNAGSLYKGFRLEIETKKYTDTVNQNRAVGKNNSGIVLIATEYSFASNPNVLIEELKFIIDRDDLKAY